MKDKSIAVVALGGNAITREFEEGLIAEQFANTRRCVGGIVELVTRGYRVAVTHGNGPQVGHALVRVEETREMIPPLPLGVIVADLQGGMGYMIQQSLQNQLHLNQISRPVATILTQVVVDENDPSILNPTKFVGSVIEPDNVDKVVAERGWVVKRDAGSGYRRVVPSPTPLEIVEKDSIRTLLEAGNLLISAGGGGIPVYVKKDGTYEGVDAVIDKDLAAAILARDIGAAELYILTSVEQVYLDYGLPGQTPLDTISLPEARRYWDEGHFPEGSMGPKIRAAIDFLESGGETVVIGSIDRIQEVIDGCICTRIVQ